MIEKSLICGLIWAALWMIYVFILEKKYPWTMLHDYPKDIQEASTMAEPDEKALKASKLVSGALGAVIIVSACLMNYICVGSDSTWINSCVSSFIIVIIWNVVDLLLMDWLIFCTIRPKWVVIDGTEDCQGYKDYFFHFKGFLIGCLYSFIMALIFGTIVYLL